MAGLIQYGQGLKNLGEQSLSSYFNKNEALLEAKRQAKFAKQMGRQQAAGYGAGLGLQYGITQGGAKFKAATDLTNIGQAAFDESARAAIFEGGQNLIQAGETAESARQAAMLAKTGGDAQAVATAELGPFAPKAMAVSPVAILGIIMGTVNGLTLPGPLLLRTCA